MRVAIVLPNQRQIMGKKHFDMASKQIIIMVLRKVILGNNCSGKIIEEHILIDKAFATLS